MLVLLPVLATAPAYGASVTSAPNSNDMDNVIAVILSLFAVRRDPIPC